MKCQAEPNLSPLPFPVDPTLSPSPAASPPAPGAELSYLNGTFRLLQKPLRWHDALLLCESRNASLAHVLDPYTQAFLTQAARGLRAPLWIGLASEEVGSRATALELLLPAPIASISLPVPSAPCLDCPHPDCPPSCIMTPLCPGLQAVHLGLGGASELRELAGWGAPAGGGLCLRGRGWGLAHHQL